MHPFRTTPSRFSANLADEPALVMKITFVLPRLMPRPTGGGKIVYQYANALAEAGHEIEVLHPRTLFLWRFRHTPAARLRSLAADCAKLMGVGEAMAGQGHRACVPWMKMHPRVKISVVPALYPRYVPHADVIVRRYGVPPNTWSVCRHVAERSSISFSITKRGPALRRASIARCNRA